MRHDGEQEEGIDPLLTGDDIFAAISLGMGEVIDRIEAARLSAVSLRSHERQTLAHIAKLKKDDPTRPTPEQVEIINGALLHDRVTYDSPSSANRVPIGTGYRIATPVHKMHSANPEQVNVTMLRAANHFYRDYNHGILHPRVCGRYGLDLAMAGLGNGGTPLSQRKTPEDPDAAKREEQKEEPHIFHAKRYISACSWIGHKQTAYWLTAVVCEVPVGEPSKVPSLEDVGRAYSGYECRKRAQAAGSTLIKAGLEKIAFFYDRY